MEQGYNLTRKIFYQDDKSPMEMEINSRKSAGDKSRNIHVRYLFINNVLIRDNIELIHCPTERMIADYFSKSLQGSLFRKMADVLMGLTAFTEEERVEYNQNTNLELSDSSIDPGTKPVTICNTEVLSTEGSKI